MRCFKKTFAFIIAGVLGITYTCGNVPVYAQEENNSTYPENMEISGSEVPAATATGTVVTENPEETVTPGAVTEIPAETITPGAITESPMETITPGAITEPPMKTTTPGAVIETQNPGSVPETESPSEGASTGDTGAEVSPGDSTGITTKEPAKPVFSIPPIQTTTPLKTNVPEHTDSPVNTNTPVNTDSPPKTSVPGNTASPIKTSVPESTISPIKTNIPLNPTSPIKTNTPETTPLTTRQPQPDITATPVPTKEPARTSSPEKTIPALTTSTPPDTQPARATSAPEMAANTSVPATQKPARQSEEEYCTIIYQLNGGKNHKNNPKKIKKKGEKVTLKAPGRAKYSFIGWYKDKTFTQKITTLGNTSASSMTLYAKWKKVTVKQVTFSFAKKKSATSIFVKVKKEKQVAGFEYVYAKESYFKKKYRLYTKKNPKTLSKLTKKKTYYIKVRAYKLDSTGNKIYGIYSKIRKVKI